MDLKLSKKTALITGSTAGIGYAIASALAQEGASVILNGRTQSRVNEAVKSLVQFAPNVRGFAADLSLEDETEALVREFPEVDILVNNFGVYESRSLDDTKVDDFARMFQLNVLSGARLSKAYLPVMKNRNWGRVLFISSESGVNVPPDMIAYGVSKAAQTALARGLAETTAGTAVTVNTVLPGPTRSEGVSRFLDSGELDETHFLARLRPTSLLRRFATAEEVASLVAYLASPLSSATNGAALRVEGGLLRSIL